MIKIYLSSTFSDLSSTRSKVSNWLQGIYGAELTIMETWGSDEAPPDINSVRRVRECELFVGIYAHRYGTIDPTSGKSITELELDEAKIALSAGTVHHILLYCINDKASWLREYAEGMQPALQGLKRLKDKASQHTYTPFKNEDELMFCILRDVYRILVDRLGRLPLQVRGSSLPAPRTLQQPIGMEFLTSENRDYLIGRERKTAELLTRLFDDTVTLLLGDSGVGKTSLIHAGLLPALNDKEVRPIYTRPLGLPCTDVIRQIQTSIFEGRPAYAGPLVPFLAEVRAALGNEHVLVIIDQFEDILTARDVAEVERLISELRTLRELADPFLHVLISYRADLEGRLGQCWQQMSGSPSGLPRVYVSGIKEDQAWQGIVKAAADMSVTIELSQPQQSRVADDLLVASRALGFPDVYPPYVQMLIHHIWLSAKAEQGAYNFQQYQKAGGIEGITGGYLNSQLDYAQDGEGHIRAVLVSLVRSYGVKAQRTLEEIVGDTGIESAHCERALEKLIDLRLVRHIADSYEVAHDFIARRVVSELVDSEEREFKRFRELLTSKAAAYQTTGALLTREELLILFKYKERIIPNELELHLLLSSWIKGDGPALYWILSADRKKVVDKLRSIENRGTLTSDEEVALVLLNKKLKARQLTSEDLYAFKGYKLSSEMSALIMDDPTSVPNDLLLYGLRHRRHEVQEVCREVIALQVKEGDWSWIGRLRGSSSPGRRQAYEHLVLRNDIAIPSEEQKGRPLEEMRILKKIATSCTLSQAREYGKTLRKSRLPKRSMLFGKGILYVRQGNIDTLLRKAKRASRENARVLLSAIDAKINDRAYSKLLSTYRQWNKEEQDRSDRYGTSAISVKATCLANAILYSTTEKRLSALRKTVSSVHLTSSSRAVVFALLKHGTIKDLNLILHRIEESDETIYFENHTEICHVLARRMSESPTGVPKDLLMIVNKKEFSEYILPEERKKLLSKEMLPLREIANRALYVRLVAYAAIGKSNEKDEKLLLELAGHNYGLIARAAAVRLVHLFSERALRKLIATTEDSMRKGRSEALATSLRSAEIELFGVASLW